MYKRGQNNDYKKKLEKFGFNVRKTSDGYEIQQYTPAGEDWNLYAKTIKDFEEVFRDFDEEEEFEMRVEAKTHGHPNMRRRVLG